MNVLMCSAVQRLGIGLRSKVKREGLLIKRCYLVSLDLCRSLLLAIVVSDLTLRVSPDSTFLRTLGGLGSPSGPLPVLLFPLCCRLCGLTLEEADLDGDKADGEDEGDGGQVNGISVSLFSNLSLCLTSAPTEGRWYNSNRLRVDFLALCKRLKGLLFLCLVLPRCAAAARWSCAPRTNRGPPAARRRLWGRGDLRGAPSYSAALTAPSCPTTPTTWPATPSATRRRNPTAARTAPTPPRTLTT